MKFFARVSAAVMLLLVSGGWLGTQAQVAPSPAIQVPLAPASAAPGGPGFTLTVNGTGFVPGSVVNWNGTARSTTFVSSTRLTAAITAVDIATPTTGTVTVSSPGAAISNPVYFQVMQTASSLSFNTSTLTTSLGGPYIATGDFNGDGKLDVVVSEGITNYPYQVAVFLGNGDGTFQAPVFYTPNQFYPVGVAVGDFNGDGKPDLAVATTNPNDGISIFLGNGDGSFQPAVFYPGGLSCCLPTVVTVADFNADGKLDVAVGQDIGGGGGPGAVAIFLGNGDGTFMEGFSGAIGPQTPTGIAVADFNGDGKLDIAAVGPSEVDVSLGNGDGTFGQATYYRSGFSNPVSVVAADFNGDGIPDLAVGDTNCTGIPCAQGGFVVVMLGKGDGTFQPGVSYTTAGTDFYGQDPIGIVAADFNGDGNLDLATISGPLARSNTLTVLFGLGDGTFSPMFTGTPASSDYAPPLPNLASAQVLGDFNGDGLMDVVEAGLVSFYPPQVTAILQAPIAPSVPSINFPPQLIGTRSGPRTVTLKNTGKTELTIPGVILGGGGASSYAQVNTCGSKIPAGGSCQVTLKFAPATNTLGSQPAYVSLTNVMGPTVSVSGIATAVSLSAASVNFGNQLVGSKSEAQTVTVTNVGKNALSVSGLAIRGSDAHDFAFSAKTCGKSLGGGASCTLSITFTPAAKGARKGTVVITDSDPASPQRITLTGTGT